MCDSIFFQVRVHAMQIMGGTLMDKISVESCLCCQILIMSACSRMMEDDVKGRQLAEVAYSTIVVVLK